MHLSSYFVGLARITITNINLFYVGIILPFIVIALFMAKDFLGTGGAAAALAGIGRIFPLFGAAMSLYEFVMVQIPNSRCVYVPEVYADELCKPNVAEYLHPDDQQCCRMTMIYFNSSLRFPYSAQRCNSSPFIVVS
jgi:hypothetical protein